MVASTAPHYANPRPEEKPMKIAPEGGFFRQGADYSARLRTIPLI